MAHFYGRATGKGVSVASRQGSKASGLETEAMSWQGMIRTRMWHDTATGRDMVRITAERHPWDKRLTRAAPVRVLYEGPVEDAWNIPPRSALAA